MINPCFATADPTINPEIGSERIGYAKFNCYGRSLPGFLLFRSDRFSHRIQQGSFGSSSNLNKFSLLPGSSFVLPNLSDDEWKFKDGHVMLTNGIDSRFGDVVVLESDGNFEGVLGAMGFGNLQQVELLQNLMRIRDVDWVSLDAIEASSIGRFVFLVDFEIEGGRLLF
ncbi:hypothetical protein F0562_001849 [Nyssa sinensis]|uniref:Uncharacterized protein n=1 Tax=Nyssa sinensis TaxID=561372 RepID=A0A5J5C4A0_9ASTE|nr:hypothetical protein F0562_001849 [Nyssa sinensis]